jgi:general secretion pathway protein G
MATLGNRVGQVGRIGARRHAPGFSLLELALVVVIMGVLISVVAFNVVGRGNEAKRKTTNVSLEQLKRAMAEYNLNHNAYPPEVQALVRAKILEDGKLKDGWGREFVYDARGRSKDQPYILSSMGEDGQPGTEDDQSVWDLNK